MVFIASINCGTSYCQRWKWVRWPGQSGFFGSLFAESSLSGPHPPKNNPYVTRIDHVKGLCQQVAWLNLAHLYVSIYFKLCDTIPEQAATNHSAWWPLSELADRLVLKNQYTLIEQSQYFKGSIRADSSRFPLLAKVHIWLPFLHRRVQSRLKHNGL